MKRIGILAAVVFLSLNLSACGKSKEAESAEKLAYFSKVYPTQKVSDLFEKFPKGFEIRHDEIEQSGDVRYRHEVKLEGNPETREIVGTYTKKDASSNEIIFAEAPAKYTDEGGLAIDDNPEANNLVKNWKFLFNILSFKKSASVNLHYDSMTNIPASSTYSLLYDVDSPKLKEYLKADDSLTMYIYGSHRYDKDGIFQVDISVHGRDDSISIGESIEEK